MPPVPGEGGGSSRGVKAQYRQLPRWPAGPPDRFRAPCQPTGGVGNFPDRDFWPAWGQFPEYLFCWPYRDRQLYLSLFYGQWPFAGIAGNCFTPPQVM